jgi:hypothetical protein
MSWSDVRSLLATYASRRNHLPQRPQSEEVPNMNSLWLIFFLSCENDLRYETGFNLGLSGEVLDPPVGFA